MSETTKIFPANKYEALALLYIQQQDISGLTPKELVERFDSVCAEMKDYQQKEPKKQIAHY